MTASPDTSNDFNKEAARDQEDWFALEAGQYKAVPRPQKDQQGEVLAIRGLVKLPVLDTEGFRARQDVVEAALVILSQSETGRRLAKTAIEQGYSINVDPPVISGLGNDDSSITYGSTDSVNKQIRLRGIDDPLQMALVIGHELTHVSQFANGGISPSVVPYHPLTAITQLMVMEGDARAHEFLIALELAYKKKDEPDERLLFPQAMDGAAANIGGPLTKAIIDHFKPQFPDGVEPQQIMARIFKSFFGDPGLRVIYENSVLHSFETLEQGHPGAWKDAKLFQTQLTGEDFAKIIDKHDIPYVGDYRKFIDLDSPLMRAVSSETREKLRDMEKIRHENPATANDRPWTDAPSFEEIAVRNTPAKPKAAGLAP